VKRALLLGVLAACDHHGAASCADDLAGVYVTPAGARWQLLDNGPTLEVFPMFDDSKGPADVVTAPRAIDLTRAGNRLDGTISRRFMRRADTCTGRAPFHVTACVADGLDVVAGDVAPPLLLAPCTPAPPLPSRAERWRRD
jgi:hypothetical protein